MRDIMKKQFILAGLLVCASVMVVNTTPTTAATFEETETTSTVKFKPQGDDSEGEVTKPETPDEIIDPEEGGSTKGTLRLNHVPNFHFNTVEIKSETAEFPALFERYSKPGETEKHNISHFIQVEDVRGKQADWKVKVSATEFIPSDAKNPVLKDSHIEFVQQKLSNTRLTAGEIKDKVATFTDRLVLGNDGNAVEVMATKTGEHTDTSKTSLVLNKDYTASTPAAGAVTIEGKEYNPGVILKAVGSDQKVVDETYTAKLTWSIESTL